MSRDQGSKAQGESYKGTVSGSLVLFKLCRDDTFRRMICRCHMLSLSAFWRTPAHDECDLCHQESLLFLLANQTGLYMSCWCVLVSAHPVTFREG